MSIRGRLKIFSKHFHHLSQHKEKCFGQIQYHIHWKQAKKVISPQALLGAGRKQICRQNVEHHKALVMTWIFHVVAPSSWKKKHFKSVSGWVGPERQSCLELAVNIMVQPGILKSSILLEAFKPTLVLICQSFHLRSDCDCPCYVVSLLEHLWKHHPSAPVPAGHFEPWKIKNIPKRWEHVRNGLVTLYNLAPWHRSHPSSLHPTSHRLVEELFLAIRLPNDWFKIYIGTLLNFCNQKHSKLILQGHRWIRYKPFSIKKNI